jgi:nitrogen fixation protein FixH
MASAFASPVRPQSRDRWIPWVFVGCMLLVVAVNGALIYFAMQSWGGLVSNHAFERGVAYNRLIAEAAAEEALGWKADVAYQPAADGKAAALVVALRDADGRPMGDATIAIEAQRPLEAQAPLAIELRYAGNGRYAGPTDALRAGQWDIRLAVAGRRP